MDNFLIILPPAGDLNNYTTIFKPLCHQVGLTVKESKNEQETGASIGGIEIDMEKMVIGLSYKKLTKAQQLVQNTVNQNCLSLLDLQKITGHLNFVVAVVPLGRTFLCRLYNMQLFFSKEQRHHRRQISSEAWNDLQWRLKVLLVAPKRSIRKESRQTIVI